MLPPRLTGCGAPPWGSRAELTPRDVCAGEITFLAAAVVPPHRKMIEIEYVPTGTNARSPLVIRPPSTTRTGAEPTRSDRMAPPANHDHSCCYSTSSDM